MKSHIVNQFPQVVHDKIRQSLAQANVAGMGYGAKSFAAVIKDKITKFSGEDKQALIDDIEAFVDKTLENSPQELAKAFAETQQRAEAIIGKEDTNG